MENGLKAKEFVTDWLNHFNYSFEMDITLNSSLVLDFLVRPVNLGIYIVDWKRPISVQIANKAIQIQRDLDLEQLFLIAREISEPARKTLNRYGQGIIPIHPNGMSELAIKLAQAYHASVDKIATS